jgi:hypothetical protein
MSWGSTGGWVRPPADPLRQLAAEEWLYLVERSP